MCVTQDSYRPVLEAVQRWMAIDSTFPIKVPLRRPLGGPLRARLTAPRAQDDKPNWYTAATPSVTTEGEIQEARALRRRRPAPR